MEVLDTCAVPVVMFPQETLDAFSRHQSETLDFVTAITAVLAVQAIFDLVYE